MSVYKPRKSPHYHFDFWHRGVRFTGSTDCSNERDAKAFEKRRRDEARIEVKAFVAQEHAPLTFAVAAARYYLEVGAHLRGEGPKNCKWSITWLEREIGGNALLSTINDALVAKLVAIRRGDNVAKATVNRSVTEPLRKILNRGRDIWAQQIQKIEWKRHILKEPKERVRILSASEETNLFEFLRADYRTVVEFAILSGCRLGEIVPGKHSAGLKWRDVNWAERTIVVNGKGGVVATIPISNGIRELLFPLQGHHDEFVFTYIAERRGPKRIRGKRYPMTREGLKTEFRRAKADAGLINYRFHDNRHTAATTVLRATGNLIVVQKLLRHADITTTAKYAHALDDDVRNGMESAEKSRTESRTRDGDDTKALKK